MADIDRTQDPRLQVELRSAAAELVVLRRALETARDEARRANVSARRAEKAMEKTVVRERARTADAKRSLQNAKRSTQKWRKKCKSAEKKYNRVTSSLVWRIYSPVDRALHRAHSILRGKHPTHSAAEFRVASDLHEVSLEEVNDSLRSLDSSGTEEEDRTVNDYDASEKVEIAGSSAGGKPKPRDSGGEFSTKTASSPTYQVPDLSSLSAMTPRGRIAVVLHLYYPELWPEFRDALSALSEPFDLFVTLTTGYSDQAADWIRADYPSAQIVTLENHGRDILPFVILINSGVLFHYDLVCKVHSKRSIQRRNGDTWRRKLVAGVLSDPESVGRVLTAFDANRELGAVVGNGYLRKEKNWLRHLQRINELCGRIGMSAVTDETGYPGYPAGSIYWIRSSLLQPIASLGLTAADFEPEPLPRDGCMVDALERLIGQICREAGMYVAENSASKIRGRLGED